MSFPSISLIIPTRNGNKWISGLLSRLDGQTLVPDEILIVDSASTDGTAEAVRKHMDHQPRIRLLEIKPQDFDHGGTRTLAVRHSQGEIVVCMTQDAIPASADAIEQLILPFSNSEQIAATYGRQLPAPDATIFGEHLRRFNYPEKSQIRSWQDRNRLGFKTIFISNSFAAWRRAPLAAQGFFPERLLFGEDTLTLAKLMEHGYHAAYVSKAAVHHSHNYSLVQDVRRYFDIGVLHADQWPLMTKFGDPGGAGRKYVLSELALLAERKKYHLVPECLLRNLGKLVAYSMGKRYRMLPRSWSRSLSMNSGWQGWTS